MNRRLFLMGGAAVSVGSSSIGSAFSQPLVLHPEDYGARGDGRSDDTAAIQRCLAAAPAGAAVRLRRGAVYRVDTNWQPTWHYLGGLKLKAGQVLELNGAELKALPSAQQHGSVVQAFGADGWRIEGPGRITGERDIHRGAGGEWGMGISVWQSKGWRIGSEVEVRNCWGDGIYVGSVPGSGAFSENFLIDDVHVWNCRRNGISVVAGRNGEIRSARIHQIDGVAPMGGIDLEPDSPSHPNRNIRISGGKIWDVGVGIYVTVANEDVLITAMDIEGDNSGIIVADNSHNVRIAGNHRIRSRIGGQEGGAIRTVGNAGTIRGLHIVENQLSGGGSFVIDIVGPEYRDLLIARNQIRADNSGTQGLARIGAGTFTDNVGIIGRNSGKSGDYFIHLQTVAYGRNVYRNESPHSMYSAIRGGRELAADRFESRSLVKYSEPL